MKIPSSQSPLPETLTAGPHSSPEQSFSKFEDNDLAISDEAQGRVSSQRATYESRESGIKGKEAKVLKTEMKKLAKHMDSWDKDFKNEWLYTYRLGWYDMDERSNDAIDVLKTYGTTQPPGLQDPSNDP
ncbi:hypothetical protein Tco_0090478 [Tanacetum coccineum]